MEILTSQRFYWNRELILTKIREESSKKSISLLNAARQNNILVIKLLVEYNADVKKTDAADSLIIQASKGETTKLLKLIDANINISIKVLK